jgi:hypothetical protein
MLYSSRQTKLEYVVAGPGEGFQYFFPNTETIDFSKIPRVLLVERDQIVFDYLATKYCNLYGLPDYIPYLFAFLESDFSASAMSHKEAFGLFQVTPICLEEYNNFHLVKFAHEDLSDMEISFEVAMWYINRLIVHYQVPLEDSNPYLLYTAYNLGPNSMFVGNTLSRQTRSRYDYAVQVINLAYK